MRTVPTRDAKDHEAKPRPFSELRKRMGEKKPKTQRYRMGINHLFKFNFNPDKSTLTKIIKIKSFASKASNTLDQLEDAIGGIRDAYNQKSKFVNLLYSATVGTKLVSGLIMNFNIFKFLMKEWVYINNPLFEHIISIAVRDHIVCKFQEYDTKYHYAMINNLPIIARVEGENEENGGEYNNFYFPKNQLKETYDAVVAYFWKNFNNVISLSNADDSEDGTKLKPKNASSLYFIQCKENPWIKSKEFFDIEEYIKKYHKQTIPRSIVLKGLSGTGKSILAKQLAFDLNLRTLIVDKNDFVSYSNRFQNLISTLGVDCLIIDDFDRIDRFDKLLSVIDSIYENIKLIILTVNNVEPLEKDLAILRPKRIDKIFTINRLDDNVAKIILGEENLDFFDDVKTFPAAFISELTCIIKAEGKEKAREMMPEIIKRVKLNKKTSGGKDDEDAEG